MSLASSALRTQQLNRLSNHINTDRSANHSPGLGIACHANQVLSSLNIRIQKARSI
ncbi:MAG: hypothetical protein ACK51L_00735 [bacterium]